MIRVYVSEYGGLFGLTVTGHSGFSDPGTDIVCASASILVYTLAEVISGEEFTEEPTVRLDEGEAFITVRAEEENEQKIRDTFSFAEAGFRLLAQEYPQNVCLVNGKP